MVGRVDLKSLKSREGRAWGRTMEFFFFFLAWSAPQGNCLLLVLSLSIQNLNKNHIPNAMSASNE